MNTRIARASVLFLCLLAAVGCNDAVTDTPTIITETFSGTLTTEAARRHDFQVLEAADVAATLSALGDPIAGASIAIGIGVPSEDECAISVLNEAVSVGSTIQATVGGPGIYCVRISDNGSLPDDESATYEIQVDHF